MYVIAANTGATFDPTGGCAGELWERPMEGTDGFWISKERYANLLRRIEELKAECVRREQENAKLRKELSDIKSLDFDTNPLP